MTTFNLTLDTNAAMLLQLAGVGVSRSTAFEVLYQIEALLIVPVGRSVFYQPIIGVEGLGSDISVSIVDPYQPVADWDPAPRWVGDVLCATGGEALNELYPSSSCVLEDADIPF